MEATCIASYTHLHAYTGLLSCEVATGLNSFIIPKATAPEWKAKVSPPKGSPIPGNI